MFIDIHAHTSTHPMHGLHMADASLPALGDLADQYAVRKTLILATYFPLKGTGLHNRELLKRIDGHDRFAAIGSLDASGDVAAGITELTELAARQQIVGIKLYPGYQPVSAADPKLSPLYQLAARYHLPVTIHGGELHHCCSKEKRAAGLGHCGHTCQLDRLRHLSHPYAIAPAIAAWPDVTFVVAHLANPYFAELREIMAAYPNIVTDFSGQFVSGSSEDTPEYRAELVAELNSFLSLPNGARRLLFATDFPIQSHADSLWLLNQLPVSPADYQRIAWRNANDLYQLNITA